MENSESEKNCGKMYESLLMPGTAGLETWKVFAKFLSERLEIACKDPPISAMGVVMKKYPKSSFQITNLSEKYWDCCLTVVNSKRLKHDWVVKRFGAQAGSQKIAKSLAAKKAMEELKIEQ